MVRGALKSSHYRKVKKRIVSKTTTHYNDKRPKQAHCGVCGKPIHGIPRGNGSDIRRLAKTQRRPERPYGGVLCSKCMREKLTEMYDE